MVEPRKCAISLSTTVVLGRSYATTPIPLPADVCGLFHLVFWGNFGYNVLNQWQAVEFQVEKGDRA